MHPSTVLVLSFLSLIADVQSSKILVVGLSPSFSHQINFHIVARELVLRGHEVTYINPYPISSFSSVPFRSIDVTKGIAEAQKRIKATLPKGAGPLTRFFHTYPKYFEEVMNCSEVQDLVNFKYGSFDLVIAEIMWPSTMRFKEVFNSKLIAFSTLDLSTHMRSLFGEVVHPILYPDQFFFSNPNLSLYERILSTWINLVHIHTVELGFDKQTQFPTMEKDVKEISLETDLVIYISVSALLGVYPNPPNVIQVDPIQFTDDAQLPNDLKEYLDASKDGVIYMSFGSVKNFSSLPPTLQNNLFWALKNLQPLNIVMTSDKHLENTPENLKNFKWMPQQAVLRHPNVKLFLSHGGLNSVSEAIHYGIPLVTVPLFGDHFRISNMLEAKEIGLQLNKDTCTGKDILGALTRVLTDRRYKENVMALSKLSRDKPMSSLNTTIWWIEYVLRNNGYPFYKPKRIPLYQFYLLDVLAVVFAASFLVLYAFYKISMTVIYWGTK